MTTTPQTLTLAGEVYVVIPRHEYQHLRDAADEDVAAVQRVLDDPDETWAPAVLVRRLVKGKHPVRVSRPPRRLTARSLAVATGIPSSYLSAIERGVTPGSPKALKTLATALDMPLDDPLSPPRADPRPRALFHRASDRLCLRSRAQRPSCWSPRTTRRSPTDG